MAKPTEEQLEHLSCMPPGCDVRTHTVTGGRTGGVLVNALVRYANAHGLTTTIVWTEGYDGTLYVYKGKPREFV